MSKSASSISSKASASASSLSKVAASSSSSLSSVASKASASSSASLSSVAARASASAAKASASAATQANKHGLTGDNSSSLTPYAIAIGVLTALIALFATLHMSGQLDPYYKAIAKKYFKAEAKAEMLALQQTGSKQAEGYLKEKLKDNPAANLGEGELDDIAKGAPIGDKFGRLGGGVGDKLGF